MPEFSGDRNYQGHHTRTEGLSVEDRYEKGIVLTHWLSGMLQPQHLTGPYLLWADCTAWYASVMFVRKKRHRSESMMSQKKWASDINLLPCGFCMTVINCLFTSSSVFMHGDIVVHLIILCLHAWTGVYFGSHAVLQQNMKPRADCHHSIMMTDKTQSSCRHSGLAWAPSAAVASWATDCAGRSLYLSAICSDKSWDKDSSATRLPPSCSQH